MLLANPNHSDTTDLLVACCDARIAPHSDACLKKAPRPRRIPFGNSKSPLDTLSPHFLTVRPHASSGWRNYRTTLPNGTAGHRCRISSRVECMQVHIKAARAIDLPAADKLAVFPAQEGCPLVISVSFAHYSLSAPLTNTKKCSLRDSRRGQIAIYPKR